MSTKRELDSPAPASTPKKRKTFDAAEVHHESTYTMKNLLKAGSIPVSSAYQQKVLTLDLYLAPIDATEPMAGVERQLDDVLLSYVKEANGILMGWNAPRFVGSVGRVLEESPFTYARIQVDTVVWKPTRGEELEGQVKFMGPSHIGLLILGTFNASIPLPLIPQDWMFEDDGDDGYWRDGNGTALTVNQTLRFKTINIKKGANILSVEGSLLEQVFQPKYEDEARPSHASTKESADDNRHDTGKADKKAEKKKRRKSEKAALKESQQVAVKA